MRGLAYLNLTENALTSHTAHLVCLNKKLNDTNPNYFFEVNFVYGGLFEEMHISCSKETEHLEQTLIF